MQKFIETIYLDGKKVLYNWRNRFTNERESYTKVTTWHDGTPMDSSKVDDFIYRENSDSEFFKLNFSRIISVDVFGVKGDGSTLNTSGFESSENTVNMTSISGAINAQNRYIPPGAYKIGPILKKAFWWNADGTDNTRLIYEGLIDVDFITQDTIVGRNSAGRITDMTIDGQNCKTIYKIPKNAAGFGADDRLLIERVRFVDGTNHIHWDAWVNAKGDNNRHDNWSGYALILEPKVSQNQSHFEYNCTYDTNSNGQTTNSPLGFCLLNLINLAASDNIGVVKFSGKRWEVNHAVLGGNKALIQINSIATAVRQAEIVLDGITIQSTVAVGVTSLFHRSAAGGTTTERYSFRNVQMNNIGDTIFAGDYPAWMLLIPTGNWAWLIGDSLNGFVGMRTTSGGATGFEFLAPTSNTLMNKIRLLSEANDRLQVRPDVTLSGTGATAPTVLLRHGGKTGWTVPAGTLGRSDPAYTAPTISDPPTQAEVQAIANQLQTTTRILAALINDLHVGGSSSPHGLLRS